MNFITYLIGMELRGFKLMGLNYGKVMEAIKLKEAKRRYLEFIDQLDLKVVQNYFEVGLNSKVFLDKRTNQPLTKDDDLWWGFYDKNYQYTLRRQPIRKKQVQPNQDEIMRKMKELKLKEYQEKNFGVN